MNIFFIIIICHIFYMVLLPAAFGKCFLCRMEGLLNQWLWQQEYWLPPGITWKDMRMEERMEKGSRYPLPRDLFLTLPLALGFIALRYVFERSVAFCFKSTSPARPPSQELHRAAKPLMLCKEME